MRDSVLTVLKCGGCRREPKRISDFTGIIRLASGGLFGTGLGESMQKLGFIPESHNDMIFSIICEELGMIGAGIVIIMFVIMMWRILNSAMTSAGFVLRSLSAPAS